LIELVDPPADDEIEITVFGRGVGECIAMHVGGGTWVVIDSYVSEFKQRNPESGRLRQVPVAQWYLDRMGVERERVAEIIITHLHRDHYKGVQQLHDHYRDAELLVTAALGANVVHRLFADPATPGPFGEMPATMVQAQRRKRAHFTTGLRPVSVGWTRIYAGGVTLRALSPTVVAVEASMADLAEHMKTNRAAVRAFLRKKLNRTCVVLHLTTAVGGALLCADLENEPTQYGWDAVLAEPSHKFLDRAGFVKVAHHGSKNADHPGMWNALVVADPIKPVMAVTPYTSLPEKLPTQDDCVRLCERGALYQAAPSFNSVVNSFGYEETEEGPTGLVRARRCPGETHWRIDLEGAAFHVEAAS
jgi:beta-lactamase superfamily II metal-dependent hydrolase